MPEPAKGKQSFASALSKKAGPLPMWGWFALGGLGLFVLRRGSSSGGQPAQVTTNPPYPVYQDFGGGSAVGYSPAPTDAPTPTAKQRKSSHVGDSTDNTAHDTTGPGQAPQSQSPPPPLPPLGTPGGPVFPLGPGEGAPGTPVIPNQPGGGGRVTL